MSRVPAPSLIFMAHACCRTADGYPEAWFTRDWVQTGPFFTTKTYHYPNDQLRPALVHDHTLAITRLNVFAGLVGFYFIRDRLEDGLNLPTGPYEVPLLIQDRMFNPDGSLQYPVDLAGTHQCWIPEFSETSPASMAWHSHISKSNHAGTGSGY